MSDTTSEMKFTPKIHDVKLIHPELTIEQAQALLDEITVAPTDLPLGWNPYNADTIGDLMSAVRSLPTTGGVLSQAQQKVYRRFVRAFHKYRSELSKFVTIPPRRPRSHSGIDNQLEYAKRHVEQTRLALQKAEERLAQLEQQKKIEETTADAWIDPRVHDLVRDRLELDIQLEALKDELEAPIDEYENLQTLIHLNKQG